ncbi:RbsD/FucU domain-containing protein [Trueperella pyogenes]|uniref:RbsD/FucU family protein n=1 Tax=Trueperella pyogenes TaxID=1661 RepID=UPI000C1B7A5D|nr:RbsD/FucU domain-containing protein [Trueperella pyogenes]AZR00595.1 fucose isomerase [Trueperella pyogenes]PIN52573.1 fucose isomerase [Trueperella pyogenes]WHU59632.1 RbsD/FucU domain-containing protein [Trueperella pyogenes]
MLKGISPKISPSLLNILARMGHGDEIVLGDANFPGEKYNTRVCRADGVGIPELLDGVLALFPLDRYSQWQIGLMQTVGDDPRPPVWETYADVIARHEGSYETRYFERYEFYEQTRGAFAVVITGETALYGNIILKKGVIC